MYTRKGSNSTKNDDGSLQMGVSSSEKFDIGCILSYHGHHLPANILGFFGRKI